MNATNYKLNELGERIIKLTPNEYEETLAVVKEAYPTNKKCICEAVKDALLHLPGIFIQLTFILDLSDEQPLFLQDVIEILNIVLQTQEPNRLLNLLINLYFLEQYGLLKENEIQRILENNSLDILETFTKFNISKQYIKKTKKSAEDNLNLDLPDIVFSDEIKIQLHQLVNEHNCKFSDTLIALQIIKTFSFSHLDCRSYLLNYFYNNDYTCVIMAMFMHYKNNPQDKNFLLCLFVGFCRVEAFISTYFLLLPEIYNIENSQELVNITMQLMYEKYYYPHKETKSLYKQYAGYDPFLNEDEKRMFIDCLNEDMIACIRLTSERDMLRDVIRPEQKHLLSYEKVFDFEDVVGLKTMLKSGQLSGICQLPKDGFFKSFIAIGHYSISHFLTYLELLKENFRLERDDQILFYNLLTEAFSDKEVYLQIVVQKLVKFGVLSTEVTSHEIQE